jgi:hypothetical protein
VFSPESFKAASFAPESWKGLAQIPEPPLALGGYWGGWWGKRAKKREKEQEEAVEAVLTPYKVDKALAEALIAIDALKPAKKRRKKQPRLINRDEEEEIELLLMSLH